jgi:hypothetical protein
MMLNQPKPQMTLDAGSASWLARCTESHPTGNQGGAASVKHGVRPRTKLDIVLLTAVIAAGACSSNAGRVATGQAGAGGSGPAMESTGASSSTLASSLNTWISATAGTPTSGTTSTLGSSASRIVPPPSGWKTIWYNGAGADIPASWDVASGTSFVCSFGATPVAYLSPTHTFYPCPMRSPGRPGNNGLWIDASYGTPGASMIETSVHGIAVDIGLAADPIIAHRIEASLRYDPAAPNSAT